MGTYPKDRENWKKGRDSRVQCLENDGYRRERGGENLKQKDGGKLEKKIHEITNKKSQFPKKKIKGK